MAESWPTGGNRTEAINQFLRSDYILERYLKHFTGGLTVMPNNICNAKCVCCPYPYHKDKKTTLGLDAFKRALDSAFEVGFVGSLQFTPMAGEPLADPTLFDKIDYAKHKGVKVISFSTNGILFGYRDIYKKLVDADITSVHISTPGFEPSYYKKIFGVDKVDDLIDGLHKLAEYKKSRSECETRFELTVMITGPEAEMMKLRGWQIIRPHLDDGTLILCGHRTAHDMFEYHFPTKIADKPLTAETGDKPLSPSTAAGVDNYSGTVTQDMLPEGWTIKQPTHTASDVPCWRLFEDAAVLPDGKVRVCSCRYMGTAHDELVIGDLTEQPLSEILWGEKHKSLIKDVAGGKWPEVCRKCSMYQPAGFSKAEVDALAAKAKRQHNRSDETFSINSTESFKARAQAKFDLAESVLVGGHRELAHNHLQGALSYSAELVRREPDNKDFVGLLNDTQIALDALRVPVTTARLRAVFGKTRQSRLGRLARHLMQSYSRFRSN